MIFHDLSVVAALKRDVVAAVSFLFPRSAVPWPGADAMTITVDAQNRLQLPGDWAEELGIRNQVVLEKTPDGILVRPAPSLTWDEVFAHKT